MEKESEFMFFLLLLPELFSIDFVYRYIVEVNIYDDILQICRTWQGVLSDR